MRLQLIEWAAMLIATNEDEPAENVRPKKIEAPWKAALRTMR